MTNKRKPNNYIINNDGTVSIELRRRNKENLWTIIDLENLDFVMKLTWIPRYNHANKMYYAAHNIYSKETKTTIGAIDLQCYLFNIDNNSNIKVDHKNNNPLDNRMSNLRKSTTKENTKNRKGKNSNNKTGFRNVAYIPSNGNKPYVVQLQINGKNKRLGSFDNAEEAGKFAEEMRQKYYGKFAGKG